MTNNKTILAWIDEMKALVNTDQVVWIDGFEEQLEELRKEVRRACEEYAPHGHFIPCITYGGPGCLFPHVDSIIDDEIEKYNKEHSCN